MRLLDLETGDFAEFSSPSTTPPYAILSHRWDKTEQTYQDIREIQKACEQNRQHAPPPRFSFRFPSRPSLSPNPGSSSLPSSPTPPQSIWDPNSGLSDKVRNACEAAREDGLRYLWIDSCCIDKTSSSELSESINSMFAWYRDAEICYTFLVDVPTSSFSVLKSDGSAFRSSVWFTRGWTLQELIAPRELVFLSQTWEPLGTKSSLSALIEEITGIPTAVLVRGHQGNSHLSLDRCSVAQRMSWAANRETTKVEDEAYSLLGIFDIQMSPLYGEGRRAFRRLQEEILRRIPDQTIFAWGNVYPEGFSTRSLTMSQPATPKPSPIRKYFRFPHKETVLAAKHQVRCNRFNFYANGSYMMFANSPRDFAGASQVVAVPHDTFCDLLATYCDISPQEYTFTPHGIRTYFPLLPLDLCLTHSEEFFQEDRGSVDWFLVLLACQRSDIPGQLLTCVCQVPSPRPLVTILRRGYLLDASREDPMAPDAIYSIFRLSLPPHDPYGVESEQNTALRLNLIQPHMLYLDHPPRPHAPLSETGDIDVLERPTLAFMLPKWARGALDTHGYATSLEKHRRSPSGLHTLTLSPRSPQTTSGLHRWTVVVEISYRCRPGERTFYVGVHATGGDEAPGPKFTEYMEWKHLWRLPLGWYRQDYMGGKLIRLEAPGHEKVTLELGIRLAYTAACYRIHVELLPVE